VVYLSHLFCQSTAYSFQLNPQWLQEVRQNKFNVVKSIKNMRGFKNTSVIQYRIKFANAGQLLVASTISNFQREILVE
jgi:hypothetical protein